MSRKIFVISYKQNWNKEVKEFRLVSTSIAKAFERAPVVVKKLGNGYEIVSVREDGTIYI